jgi:hypothetical protein
VDNNKRDPFEMATGETQETLLGTGGALAGPVTAYISMTGTYYQLARCCGARNWRLISRSRRYRVLSLTTSPR